MQVIERPSGLSEVHGSGKIELFDERGRKESEQPFENAIVAAGLEDIRWAQRFHLARGMPNGAWRAGSPRVLDPFMGVLLTTSTLAEGHALDGMPLGLMVGWANKSTYSGSDIRRGSPNAGECLATPDSVKWVFDWPTHAAIGTVGSVLWAAVNDSVGAATRWGPAMPRLGSAQEWNNALSYRSRFNGLVFHNAQTRATAACGIAQLPSGVWVFTGSNPGSGTFAEHGLATLPADYTAWTLSTARLGLGPLYANIGLTTTDFGVWCACDATQVFVTGGAKIRRFPISSLGSNDATEATVTADGSWTAMRDCSHDGTYLWICESATNKVIRIDPSTGALERQWAPPNAAEGEVVMAIAYDPTLGRVWLGTVHTSGPNRLYLCDLDGTPLAQWSMADWYWSSLTDTTASASTGLDGQSTSSTWGLCVASDGKLLCTWTGGLIFEINPISAGTRTLLGSPVTKTSFQSMKLTYSFTFS